MRNTIKEFIEPTNKEKSALWKEAVFVFDTNVLLNLYRYSAKTRNSLLEAFENFKDRVWIPYQVAVEYMNRRCEVIYETVLRYDQFKKEIDSFTGKAVEILRLTSNDEEISDLQRYLFKWLDHNKDTNLLVVSAEEDEILEKILTIFDGRVGSPMDETELNKLKEEGKNRYEKSVPPGFKDDKKKNSPTDDHNAYGDLIIWKQIMSYAKEKKTGIVYVTHDQKPDWWNIVKGKTIGPRTELRKEFYVETNQEFHMYSMHVFIHTYNKMNENPIDKSAVDEVIGLEKSDLVNREISNHGGSLSEKIAVLEDTIQKIQNRILRRQKILDELKNEYSRQGNVMPENIQLQYDNTILKKQELEKIYARKCQDLSILKNTLHENKGL